MVNDDSTQGKKVCPSTTVIRLCDDGMGNFSTERLCEDAKGSRLSKLIVHSANGKYYTRTAQEGDFGQLIVENADSDEGYSYHKQTKIHRDGVVQVTIKLSGPNEFLAVSEGAKLQDGNEIITYRQISGDITSCMTKEIKIQPSGERLVEATWLDDEGNVCTKTDLK